MNRYELAQLNIGLPAAPLDSPQMADFMIRTKEQSFGDECPAT